MQWQQNRQISILQCLSHFLWKDRAPVFVYGLALLLAVLFIFHMHPLSFLMGSGELFELGDAATNITGWMFYARDTWHFPLLHTERLGHPDGANIAFTDSIPLAALPGKLIAPWLPSHFHYFGLWHAVVFGSQAVAATFLIRSLGLRHMLATLSAVLFALTWPALLWRLGHTALMTHSLLLFALAFYFLGKHGQWRSHVTAAAFIALNLAALMIHPYFLAFCYPVFLAFLADQAMAGEGWKKQGLPLLASIVTIGMAGVVLGYFGNGNPAGGFEFYSMNLLAPFCGGEFLSCSSSGTGGQYEGYNYLGAGLLLLMPFAVVEAWPAIKTIHKRYPALILVLVLFVIYALSTRIYVGPHKLLSYSWPSFLERLTGTFRVSGRFFWIVGYALLFATLLSVLKKPSWRSVLLLAIALPLQWADIESLRERNRQTVAKPGRPDMVQWEKAMTEVEKIHIYPVFECIEQDVKIYLHFQHVASHYEKLLNTGYVTRRAKRNCAENERLFDAAFQPRHLYVMSTDYLKQPTRIPAGFKSAIQRSECVKWQDVALCQAGTGSGYWEKTGLQTEPLTAGGTSAQSQ